MNMFAVLTAFSLVVPVFVGSLLVKRISADIPPGLRVALGAALGTAIAGTMYFLSLLLSDSSRVALATSESVLGAGLVILLWSRDRGLRNGTKAQPSNRFYILIFAIVAILAGAALIFDLDFAKHAGGDALVIWNLRARLIATSRTTPLSAILDRVFLGFHPDYPLLLPALVARGWQYTGRGTLVIPLALASLFTIATVGIAVAGLRQISTYSQSWIAGCILAGTPFLLGIGAAQFADIVVCCFMTAAVVLYGMYDLDLAFSRLPFLAGMAASAAACTKNEGILFVLVLLTSRIAVAFVRRTWTRSWREMLEFAAGASLGLLTLLIFKLTYSPPSEIVWAITAQKLMAGMTNNQLNLTILRGFRNSLNFGQWYLNPIPLMAIHAAVAWKPAPASTKIAPWFTATFVLIGMLCGYYILYLVSPYDVEWHIQSSLDRLLVQLWPTCVVAYSVLASSRSPGRECSAFSRGRALRIAAVLAVIAVTLAINAWPAQETQTWIVTGTRPHIELSRTEITTGQSYTVKIPGIGGHHVYISYTLDGTPMGQFATHIGTLGSAEFQVSPTTPKGTYRFLAIRKPEDSVWVSFENDVSITVK
ncbi:MAG TPA: hypothetical protein VER98_12160 [Terriglobia bacterium]|nr:hypothetical protein [Terriglobia bacterium]